MNDGADIFGVVAIMDSIPWLLALLGGILAAGVALFAKETRGKSGYTITEEVSDTSLKQ